MVEGPVAGSLQSAILASELEAHALQQCEAQEPSWMEAFNLNARRIAAPF
jgi:hypothetical protein